MPAISQAETVFEQFICLARQMNGVGPFKIARFLRQTARFVGAHSLAYTLRKPRSSSNREVESAYYGTRKSIVLKHRRSNLTHSDINWVSHVLEEGIPVSLSTLSGKNNPSDKAITRRFSAMVEEYNYTEAHLVPLYGPFGVNAVVGYGFNTDPRDIDLDSIDAVSTILPILHNELVKIFYRPDDKEMLSLREQQVLTWIARGKSSSETATILQISISSVDTYTRRIFSKLGVNDRVSAAVAGINLGLVSP